MKLGGIYFSDMRLYGLQPEEAYLMTPEIRQKVEDFREKHGLPARKSPLVRGYLLDLLRGKA